MHTVNKTIIHRSNTLWLAISVALFAHIPFSLSAKAATSIVSRVTTDHTLQSSRAPAALVSTDELALDYWFLPGGVITPAAELLASADSRTQIGAGQVGVASGYVVSQSPPFAGATGGRTPLLTRASATSNWTDTWKVAGGTTGDLVSISLAGYIEYDIAERGGRFLQSLMTPNHAFAASSLLYVNGSIAQGLDELDFVANAASTMVDDTITSRIDWSYTLAARSGQSVNLRVFFAAYVVPQHAYALDPNCLLSQIPCSGGFAFSAMDTSRLTTVSLSQGYALQSESGLLSGSDGLYQYPYLPSVPEPNSLLLVIVGLPFLLAHLTTYSRTWNNY